MIREWFVQVLAGRKGGGMRCGPHLALAFKFPVGRTIGRESATNTNWEEIA
jgi:hypothetical protein